MANPIKAVKRGVERHKCKTWREGDWIVIGCHQCGYEKRINWKSGKIKEYPGNSNAIHYTEHQVSVSR